MAQMKMKSHSSSCKAYGNNQPPYEECTCGTDKFNADVITYQERLLEKVEYELVVILTKEEVKVLCEFLTNQYIHYENIPLHNLVNRLFLFSRKP